MKKTAILLSAMLTSTTALAAVPIAGWYASAFVGAAYLPDNVNTTVNGLYYNNSKYNMGYDVGASLGYKSGNLRYEIEGTYIKAKPDQFNINGVSQTGVNGHSTAVSGMANVYVDFEGFITSVIQPYLGAGTGYAYVKNELSASGPTIATSVKNSNTVFAYQGMAGVTYNFAENYAATLGYRYLGTDSTRYWGKRFQAHMGNVSVIYRFDEAEYK